MEKFSFEMKHRSTESEDTPNENTFCCDTLNFLFIENYLRVLCFFVIKQYTKTTFLLIYDRVQQREML